MKNIEFFFFKEILIWLEFPLLMFLKQIRIKASFTSILMFCINFSVCSFLNLKATTNSVEKEKKEYKIISSKINQNQVQGICLSDMKAGTSALAMCVKFNLVESCHDLAMR